MITMAQRRTRSTTDTLAGMPMPSRRLKDDLADDLDHHASIHWPQLGEIRVRWRGGNAYVTGHLDTDDETAIPLCRLGYLDLDDEWEFALYDPAIDAYTATALPDGSFTGTPQDALDCACQVHLADVPTPPPEPL
jgi:hypothetical protein